MLICSFPKKMAESYVLAPVLLWLTFPWAKVAEGALQKNRSATLGSPFLLPAAENVQDASSAHGDFPEGKNASEHMGLQQQQARSRQGFLEALLPVGRPVLWKETPQGKRGIRLICQVPGGKVDAIEWGKDGKAAFAGKEQRLSARLSILSLPDTEASSCGSYSCNASNAISWKESPSLRLTFADSSTVLGTSFQISASVLVFAAFCGGGILMPICQPQKLRIRGKAWKWLSIYANSLACLASVLTLVALVLWSYDQGFYASLIFPIILLIYVILVTALLAATIAFKLNGLHEITDNTAQHMLVFTMPGGVVLDTVISSLLMKHIRHLQVTEKRCAEPVDLTLIVTGAAGMCLLPFTAIVVLHCIDMKRRTAEDRVSRKEKWRKELQEAELQLGHRSIELQG